MDVLAAMFFRESRCWGSTGSSTKYGRNASSSLSSTLAAPRCTRPWKSMAMPMSSPPAERASATRARTASIVALVSMYSVSAVPFILKAVKPAASRRGHLWSDVFRPVAAEPRVGADLCAQGAAQQVGDRSLVVLALDVPERLIDARDGAHEDRPSAIEAAAVKAGPEALDVARILAQQLLLHLVDGGHDRRRAALENRLSPPAQACIGLDLDHAPAWRDEPRLDVRDLHVPILFVLSYYLYDNLFAQARRLCSGPGAGTSRSGLRPPRPGAARHPAAKLL